MKSIVALLIFLGIPLIAISQEKTSYMEVLFQVKDSVKYITAKLKEQVGDSIGKPVEGIDVLFLVERTFKPLPIGGMFNTTDENGEVTIEFPADLPGDTLGNVTILVKIEDAEEFRDTTIKHSVAWGIPVKLDVKTERRTLWAARANAPISLVILVNSILLVVWGILFYILYQMYLIWKE